MRRFLRYRIGVVGLVALVLTVVTVLAGGRFWRYTHTDITSEYSSPPSWQHPMGTDSIGHDMLAQVLQGTERSMLVALLVALLTTIVGITLGAVAGYFGGLVDSVLMRLTDLVLLVPGIAVLAVLAGSARTRSWLFVALIVAALTWTRKARLVRGTVISLREEQFVEAARASGARGARIIWWQLLPNVSAPIIVATTLSVATAILAEASLSFLGLGITPPDTSLGRLIASGQVAASTRPWLFYFPGLAILLMVVSVNFVGEGLRQAFDRNDQDASSLGSP